MSSQFYQVGKWKGRRLDGVSKITGQTKFGADMNLPNQLYMKIKRSTIPSGTIASMDTTAAMKVPGVVAIVTPNDIKNDPVWGVISSAGTSVYGLTWSAVPVLPFDKIRCCGEEIAAVVAEDPYAAEEAVQAISVTYNSSPFVLHPLTAKSTSAPQVYDGTANQVAPTVYSFGDPDTAMKDTTIQTYTAQYESSHWQNNNIIPWSFTVKVDNAGRTEMWSSNQYAKTFQYSIADALHVARSRVRCYNESCDGGFGDKTGVNRAHYLGVWLAQKTGRPVHYLCEHEDNLIRGNHRNKVVFQIQIGYKSDGTVTAVIANLYGCNSAFGGGGTSGSALGLYAVYKFPNFRITTYDVYSNTDKCGPIRCVADPYAMWCINSSLDEIAQKLGMKYTDVVAKNNMYVAGDKDQQTGNRIASCGQPDVYNKALAATNFVSKWKAPPTNPSQLTGVVHGIGLANHSCSHGSGSSTSAVAIMLADGSVEIHADSNSLGQGRREELAIVAAEQLGLPFSMVTINNYDSDGGTDTGVSAGSTQTKRAGNAVGAACIDLRNQMLAKAATSLNTTPDQLTYYYDGSMKIALTSDATKSVTFKSLTGEPMLIGTGHYIAPTKTTQRVYATCVAEVDVDTDTGLISVTNFTQVQDIGRVLFAAGWEGQAQSGMMQAISAALQEEQWPDIPTGKNIITSHLDHKLQTTHQLPPLANCQFIPFENPESPPDSVGNYGAKGQAEPLTGPGIAAIANAFANATGVHLYQVPFTPEKVLAALGKANVPQGTQYGGGA
ncbi:MAG TPA: xanthine dehydrogenase family protein molybdopterin-binding subunit [Conexivisphaerales archaeon]|nr:xanthine dehydrogenase family protein molybdopterin-binding subunit [Conexivisphaerales archaeon]